MILKGEVFRTASGRPKQRGRGDQFWLEAETAEESIRLETARKVGQPTSLTGSAVYVHTWRRSDLVVWDNRQTTHRVRGYDESQPRDMRRTTVAGDAPTTAQVAAA